MKQDPKNAFVIAADDAPTDNNVATTTRQFATFSLANEQYAVEMAPVREIIRIPELVRMPLGPPSLEGIANLRGTVLPMVSLRRILGLPDQVQDEASRAIVIENGQRLGFVVDHVSSVISVDMDRIESAETIDASIDTAFLSGVVKQPGSDKVVMILDFSQVIEREFAAVQASVAAREAVRAAVDKEQDKEDALAENQLVSFMLAGQSFAIEIASVCEIVQLPDQLAQLPGAPRHVLGVCTLRERLLPIVSARAMFGLAQAALDEKCRVLVLRLGTMSVGLAVDSVSEILRIASSDRRAVPELLYGREERAVIASMCLSGGDRLTAVIDIAALFDHRTIADAIEAADASVEDGPSTEADDQAITVDEQIVAFALGSEGFGIPIAHVKEIVRLPEALVRVPKAGHSVEGVFNLRGTVLPIVDLRSRLGMSSIDRNERQRIMVLIVGGNRIGFIVDQVTQVINIPRSAIEAAPALSGEQGRLIPRVANLIGDGRLIQLIEPEQLAA